MSENIKYRSNLAATFNFAITSSWMIIYTGNYTFPIAIISVFRTKLYTQLLHSPLWFLTSYKRQLSNKRVPPSYERLTPKCSFYYKPVNYLTVTPYLTFWFHFSTFIENGCIITSKSITHFTEKSRYYIARGGTNMNYD